VLGYKAQKTASGFGGTIGPATNDAAKKWITARRRSGVGHGAIGRPRRHIGTGTVLGVAVLV